MNAHNEQHFTAADMADQAASAFERGRESVLAEQPAAAQEAVAYRLEVQTVGSEPFMQYVTDRAFIATLRNAGCKVSVTPLYTAPVTAAPAGVREAVEAALRDLDNVTAFTDDASNNIGCAEGQLRWVLEVLDSPAAPGIDLEYALAAVAKYIGRTSRMYRYIAAELKKSDASPKGGSEAAWNDCKVAFGFDGDADAIWDAWQRGQLSLPSGWALNETDGAGARMVAVFRVDGVPAPQDGETVRKLLDMLEKAQAGDAEVSK